MWQLSYIKIQNFRSHKDTLIEPLSNQTTLLYGLNLDDEGADSNGSGKSSIIEAISILLLDITNRDILKEDYIRDGRKTCFLEGLLVNKFLKKELLIKRKFERGKSEVVTIEENGKIEKNLVSVDDANKRILELIGISKEDLLDYFLINQENSSSFFKSTDGEKKRIIARFTNSVMLERVLRFIDEDLKKLSIKYEEASSKLVNFEGKLEVYKEQLENEQKNKEQLIEEQLKVQNNLLKETKQVLKDTIEERVVIRDSVNELGIQLMELKEKQKPGTIKKIKEDIENKRKELEVKEENHASLSYKIVENKKILKQSITCPKCSHEFSFTSPEINLGIVKKLLKKYEEESIAVESQIEKFEQNIVELKVKLSKQKESVDLLDSFERKLNNKKNDLDFFNESVRTKKDNIEKIEKTIKDIQNYTINKTKIIELVGLIGKIKKQMTILKDELLGLENKMNELKFWKVNFGNSGFSTYLANKALIFIEGYVNKYLKQFKTNLTIIINGYKKLKNGKISEKIDILVGKGDGTYKNFKRFSGGQKQRINSCGILTLQRMINSTSKSGGLDLLLMDEYLEGLDNKGQAAVLEIFKKSEITTLVVSHHNNDIGWDNQILVSFKNNVSKMITE
jgi:DNA repair exonuclease SbcCD ATPase subunit